MIHRSETDCMFKTRSYKLQVYPNLEYRILWFRNHRNKSWRRGQRWALPGVNDVPMSIENTDAGLFLSRGAVYLSWRTGSYVPDENGKVSTFSIEKRLGRASMRRSTVTVPRWLRYWSLSAAMSTLCHSSLARANSIAAAGRQKLNHANSRDCRK